MLAVVGGSVVVLVQQSVQHRDGLASFRGFFQPAARPEQVGVAVRYIAATGVTHSVYSVKLTVSRGSMCRCVTVTVTVSLQQFNATQYQFVTTDEFGVPVTAVATDQP